MRDGNIKGCEASGRWGEEVENSHLQASMITGVERLACFILPLASRVAACRFCDMGSQNLPRGGFLLLWRTRQGSIRKTFKKSRSQGDKIYRTPFMSHAHSGLRYSHKPTDVAKCRYMCEGILLTTAPCRKWLVILTLQFLHPGVLDRFA